jgi:hypothetical protein
MLFELEYTILLGAATSPTAQAGAARAAHADEPPLDFSPINVCWRNG